MSAPQHNLTRSRPKARKLIGNFGPVAKMNSVELCVDPGRPIFGALNLRLSSCDRMRLGPNRNGRGVDSLVLPPDALVGAPVKLTMVQLANGHGEPVADLASHRPWLRKFDVVGI